MCIRVRVHVCACVRACVCEQDMCYLSSSRGVVFGGGGILGGGGGGIPGGGAKAFLDGPSKAVVDESHQLHPACFCHLLLHQHAVLCCCCWPHVLYLTRLARLEIPPHSSVPTPALTPSPGGCPFPPCCDMPCAVPYCAAAAAAGCAAAAVRHPRR